MTPAEFGPVEAAKRYFGPCGATLREQLRDKKREGGKEHAYACWHPFYT